MLHDVALAVILAAAGIYLLTNAGSVMINLGRGEQMPSAFLPGCARLAGVLLLFAAVAAAAAAFCRR
jgi:hypothetical protein